MVGVPTNEDEAGLRRLAAQIKQKKVVVKLFLRHHLHATRLKRYAEERRGSLFETPELHRVIEDLYRYPLTQAASDRLNSNLRDGIGDEMLAQLAILLRDEQRLSIVRKTKRLSRILFVRSVCRGLSR